jgi:hypothetical protein
MVSSIKNMARMTYKADIIREKPFQIAFIHGDNESGRASSPRFSHLLRKKTPIRAESHIAKKERAHTSNGDLIRSVISCNDMRGALKSPRAKYCCAYCRVDACRRSRPKPEQTEKSIRKRRRDAKYSSHSERQRAYHARHRPYQLPQPI